MAAKEQQHDVEKHQKLADSLSLDGCLLYSNKVAIERKLYTYKLLHEEHFGIQRIKQLGRAAVYWPNIDDNILDLCSSRTECGEHQNLPSRRSIHSWMVPEKPWSHLRLDYAVNFMDSN